MPLYRASFYPSTVAVNTAIISITNTTERQIVATTMNANSMAVGTTFRFNIVGLITNTTAATNLTVRARVTATTLTGATPIAFIQAMGTTARTNSMLEINGLFTVYTTGASGTALGQAGIVVSTPVLAVPTTPLTSAQTIDTTLSRLVEITLQSSANTTTIAVHSASLEIVKIS